MAGAPFAGPLLADRAIAQTCWVVPDLEAAMAGWSAAAGAGPWLVMDSRGTVNPRYRGQPTDVFYRAAMAQCGDVQIELVEQPGDAPSCFRDVVPAGRTGFHHLAFVSGTFDDELARFARGGFTPAFEGGFGDMRFAMMDTLAATGFMIEVLEDTPSLAFAMGLVRRLAEEWDGTSDPVRRIEEFF